MNVTAWRCLSGALIVAALSILFATGVRPRLPVGLHEWRTLVGLWLAGFVATGLTLTVAARVLGGTEATVSASLQQWFHDWPVIPSLIFLVLGHILWPVYKR